MSDQQIAAIVYAAGQGDRADATMFELVGELTLHGIPLAGTVQHVREGANRHSCDMIVTDIASGEAVNISEDRGPLARGCRLDRRKLEHLVMLSVAALEAGAQVLIVNKFGKRETEGGGFRPAIVRALELGIPVIVGVNGAYLDAWREFAGDFATELDVDLDAVRRWVGPLLGVGAAYGLEAAQ